MKDLTQYKEKLEKLENYHDFSIEVSNATGGHKNVSWNLIWSNQLFIRMTVTCMSLLRLLPYNRNFKVSWEFWDSYSILSLARNFIETYLMMWYIGIDKIDPSESDLRLDIFNFHLNSERYKFYKDTNTDHEILNEFDLKLPIDMANIKSNPLFVKLVTDPNRKKQILKGNEAKYLTNLEIINKIPFKTEEFKPLYRFFSNHTHSMPFAIISTGNQRGVGKRNNIEVEQINLTLDFVTKYLIAATIDTISLFPSCINKLNQTKLGIIQSEFLVYSQNL